MKLYMVKEIFASIQGEGVRAGTPALFIRFAGCNLDCNEETTGWCCDTDFAGGEPFTLGGLADQARMYTPGWIIFTGGEPGLQLDQPLVDVLHTLGWKLAIETNGTMPLPRNLDWVCVSPKTDRPKVTTADEVKCVVVAGQQPDTKGVAANHLLISPAFKGDEPDPAAIAWCVQWVLDHPGHWRLSCQQHKWWGVQ